MSQARNLDLNPMQHEPIFVKDPIYKANGVQHPSTFPGSILPPKMKNRRFNFEYYAIVEPVYRNPEGLVLRARALAASGDAGAADALSEAVWLECSNFHTKWGYVLLCRFST